MSLDSLKASRASNPVNPLPLPTAPTAPTEVPEVKQKPIPVAKVEPKAQAERVYTCYKSTMDNQRIAMTSGRIIRITAGKYITDNKEEIAFLDKEIEAGFPYLSKAAAVTSSDLDPMASLRKRIIAEYKAEQAAIAAGTLPAPEVADMGSSEPQKLTPANSAILKNLSAGSDSPSA